MTVNDGGFLNAVRDGSCTHVLNLLENGGIDLEPVSYTHLTLPTKLEV